MWLNAEWNRKHNVNDNLFTPITMGSFFPKGRFILLFFIVTILYVSLLNLKTYFFSINTVPMQDNGCDCGVFLCKYLLAMYNLRYDSIPFCTLFGSETPLHFLTESVHFQFNTVDISQFRSNLVQLLR